MILVLLDLRRLLGRIKARFYRRKRRQTARTGRDTAYPGPFRAYTNRPPGAQRIFRLPPQSFWIITSVDFTTT
jgi:hypothetical protein